MQLKLFTPACFNDTLEDLAMTLRKKTLIAIGLTLVGLLVVLFSSLKGILLKSYAELEEQAGRQHVLRALNAVNEKINTLNMNADQYASWDDTYNFIENKNESYIRENLIEDNFKSLGINLMIFIDTSGKLVVSKGFDLETGREMQVPESLHKYLFPTSKLLQHPDIKNSVKGIIMLPEGPMLVASQPILTSKFEGPARGTLVMGRYLDAAEIKGLTELTSLQISIHPIDDPVISSDLLAKIKSMDKEILIEPVDEGRYAGNALLKDINGKPALLLRLDRPRLIYQQGQITLNYFLYSLLTVGIVFGLMILLVLEKLVLSRLAGLSKRVSEIGDYGNFSGRINATGTDELTNLAGSVNNMLEKLEKSHQEVQESEERYRCLVELSPDGIVVLRGDKIVFVNSSGLTLLGITHSKNIIGKSILDVLHPKSREGTGRLIQQLSEETNSRCIESKIFRLDGTVVDIESASAPVTYEGRDSLQIIFRDINNRKQAEAKLQWNETLLRTMAEASPLALYVVDNRTDEILYFNERFCEIWGLNHLKEQMRSGKLKNNDILPHCMLLLKNAKTFVESIERIKNEQFKGILEHELEFLDGRTIQRFSTQIRDIDNRYVGRFYIYWDFTERKQLEQKLKYLSLHDPLTGLYNRTFFEEELTCLGKRHCTPGGIILCDVDGLKLVNDTLGHDTGDTLLVTTAEVIRKSFWAGDMMARIGGDEFAILLPGCNKIEVEGVVQRIRDAVQDYNRLNPKVLLSISVGFAVSEDMSVNLGDIFKEADNNMYREKLHRSQSNRSAIVQTLMKALEARDFITEGHGDRLQELVAGLAVAIGMPSNKINDLRLLAQFHDVGKVGIPDRILFKPGPLTPEESREMQRHCEIGYRIAQSAPELIPIAEWVLKHHEWWNGQGYPLGLREQEIPLECRILAIADAYDAMTNDRPYRKALSRAKAVTQLKRCSGTQFDPVLVDKFIEVLKEKEIH